MKKKGKDREMAQQLKASLTTKNIREKKRKEKWGGEERR